MRPLPVADDHAVATAGWASLLDSPGGRLFVERSVAAGTSWPTSQREAERIAMLCRRLDGLPLALELVAARTRSMSPADMLEHLDERFRLVSAPGTNQQPGPLLAALESSRDLLTRVEAQAFDALSVFSGDFDLEAAGAVLDHVVAGDVAAFDLVGRLVDRSLIEVVVPGTRRRFRALESIREFAGHHLRLAGLEEAAQLAHAAHYGGKVEEAWALHRAPDGVADLLSRLDADQHEILIVIDRMQASGDACGAQRLAGAMGWYWAERDLEQRGLRICNAIGDTCPNQDPAILWCGHAADLRPQA